MGLKRGARREAAADMAHQRGPCRRPPRRDQSDQPAAFSQQRFDGAQNCSNTAFNDDHVERAKPRRRVGWVLAQ